MCSLELEIQDSEGWKGPKGGQELGPVQADQVHDQRGWSAVYVWLDSGLRGALAVLHPSHCIQCRVYPECLGGCLELDAMSPFPPSLEGKQLHVSLVEVQKEWVTTTFRR